MTRSRIEAVFGWPLHADTEVSPRSLMNFPMQANRAEMLAPARGPGTDRGAEICVTVHDAVPIGAPLGPAGAEEWRENSSKPGGAKGTERNPS